MRATVAFTRELSASYRRLGIRAPEFGDTFLPGQFVMVRPPLVLDPLLPRAFSIYRVSLEDGSPVVEILYKIVGKGTHYLAQMEPGQSLEILGPLGNGFTLPPAGGSAVLVAGGIGVPPIAALAAEISRQPSAISHQQVFLGGRTAEDILCLEDFEAAGATVHITTEDGSLGTRGLITELLNPFLSAERRAQNSTSPESDPSNLEPRTSNFEPRSSDLEPRTSNLEPLTLFTCGPPGMLAAVARLAAQHQVLCQTSVEANMACGFGACMGCAVEARSVDGTPAYKLVCKDGPVFDSRELVWR
jgi:dihydroorotate dehydrogenase electron transfer subunit